MRRIRRKRYTPPPDDGLVLYGQERALLTPEQVQKRARSEFLEDGFGPPHAKWVIKNAQDDSYEPNR